MIGIELKVTRRELDEMLIVTPVEPSDQNDRPKFFNSLI